MRVGWALSLALLAAAAVCAAAVVPADSAGPAGSPNPALRAEAERYATSLKNIVDRIETAYVRPVSQAELYEAAIAGLYEAVRIPPPAGLRADIERALKGDIVWFLVRTRESLGHADAIAGQKAVAASLQTLPRALDPYCGLTARREFQRLDLKESVPNTGLEFVGVPLVPASTAVVIQGGGRIVQTEVDSPESRSAPPAGPLRVEFVQPGSPAQKAGVRPGDLITRINGQPSEAPGFAALFQRLRPHQNGAPFDPAGQPLRLTVLRPGREQNLELSVAPTAYRPESVFGARRGSDGAWNYMLEPAERIGYVRLGGIRNDGIGIGGRRSGSREDLQNALHSLESGSMRGLVLDLRWCPGGYLSEAASIARLFLAIDRLPAPAAAAELLAGASPLGEAVTAVRLRTGSRQFPIASQRERKRTPDGQYDFVVSPVEWDSDVADAFGDFPLVVLVNDETSGGGELIAAALQDYGRAAVAGQRTVGKASVQRPPEQLSIPIKLTTGTFLRPSGKNLQRFPDSKPTDDWGVRPDPGRELPLTADAARRLKENWIEFTLRPAGGNEALPLDDPENDPQLRAAAQMVRDLIK
jgi:carboxyl-terminal processing protease